MTSTVNLIVTVVILGAFHQSETPVPQWLKILVFNVIGPITCIQVNDRNLNNITPNYDPKNTMDGSPEVALQNLKCDENITTESNEHITRIEKSSDENYPMDWKIVSRILDRFMFILNIIAVTFALGYFYITLFTHQ